MMMLLGSSKWDHGTKQQKKKHSEHTASIHSGNREILRKGEIWSVFFGRIRTSRKKSKCGGKQPIQAHKQGEGKHRKRERGSERRKKRLVEADDEEEEVHYILYQKHIFKVNSQPKKSFSNARTLLVTVAPIEFELLSGLPAVPCRPSVMLSSTSNLFRGLPDDAQGSN
jgi:hypothetical protein